MNTSFDDYTFDSDLLQDVEKQLYHPLPDGLEEQSWLDLSVIERDWERSSSFEDAEREQPLLMPEDSPDFDLDL